MHSAKGRKDAGTKGRTLGTLACLLALSSAGALSARAEAPDAVIELWEQHWTQRPDGAVILHVKQHVRLNDERANGEFADPRITYRADTDQLELITARTRLPSGQYRELPDYAKVVVGADGASGWPAFAGLQQQLLVMSGIEPGAVVELEYKLTSAAGARPPLAADLRLDHRYPIRKRVISVEVPPDAAPPAVVLTGPAANVPLPSPQQRKWTLEFSDLPAAVDEPQAPPWQVRSPRLIFSTAGPAAAYLDRVIQQLNAAADGSGWITKLATEWTKDQKDAAGKMRALQEKLAARFSFVEFPTDWRPGELRPASEVLESNYGLPAEAAAALLALARAAQLSVFPGVLVRDEIWNPDVPQDGMIAAYVVLHASARAGDETSPSPEGVAPEVIATAEIWEARRGRLTRDARWAGCSVLLAPAKRTPDIALPAWDEFDASRCAVQGKVTIADDGNFAGDLTLSTAGLFVSSESLRTADAQKARLAALLGRVIPDLTIDTFAVTRLSATHFEAAVKVKSAKPLKKVTERLGLVLPGEFPFTLDVPLPLSPSRRQTPVRLTGAFDEHVNVTFEWPEKWQADVLPSTRAAVEGSWGLVSQTATVDGRALHFQRHVRLSQNELPPDAFVALRTALNDLRSEHARTLLFMKPEPPPKSPPAK